MITLSLASIQAAISAAFDHWLDQKPENFQMELEGHNVEVTIALVQDRFNCGIPGYNMSSADIQELAAWVPNNIKHGNNKGMLAPLKNGVVNVWLKGGVYVMFNFHVNIV
ncbi:MAG: hypothetical protein JXQ93_12490 [Flavobacteriaceae bacterium]